jgi:hypothetical protein
MPRHAGTECRRDAIRRQISRMRREWSDGRDLLKLHPVMLPREYFIQPSDGYSTTLRWGCRRIRRDGDRNRRDAQALLQPQVFLSPYRRGSQESLPAEHFPSTTFSLKNFFQRYPGCADVPFNE